MLTAGLRIELLGNFTSTACVSSRSPVITPSGGPYTLEVPALKFPMVCPHPTLNSASASPHLQHNPQSQHEHVLVLTCASQVRQIWVEQHVVQLAASLVLYWLSPTFSCSRRSRCWLTYGMVCPAKRGVCSLPLLPGGVSRMVRAHHGKLEPSFL